MNKNNKISCVVSALVLIGFVVCIALCISDYAGYGAIALIVGIAPAVLYAIVTKIKESIGLSPADPSLYIEKKTGVVTACEVSSYKKQDKNDFGSAEPAVYRLTVDVDGKQYSAYSVEEYLSGDEILLYINPDSTHAKVAGRPSGYSAEFRRMVDLYAESDKEVDALFDDMAEKCNDDTYDLICDEWDRITEEYDKRENFSVRELYLDKYDAAVMLRRLIEQYSVSEFEEVNITSEQLREFVDNYDPSRYEKKTETDEPESGSHEEAEKESALDRSAEPEISAQSEKSEKHEKDNVTEKEEPQHLKSEQQRITRASVGYKGINHKR